MRKATAGFGLLAVMVLGVAYAEDQKNNQNNNQIQDIRGQIVRVDPDKNIVVIRTGTGDAAREQEFTVGTTTKYWGTDRQALSDGIRAKTFTRGTDVWYRVGTGDNRNTISELRFFNPAQNNNNPNPSK